MMWIYIYISWDPTSSIIHLEGSKRFLNFFDPTKESTMDIQNRDNTKNEDKEINILPLEAMPLSKQIRN